MSDAGQEPGSRGGSRPPTVQRMTGTPSQYPDDLPPQSGNQSI